MHHALGAPELPSNCEKQSLDLHFNLRLSFKSRTLKTMKGLLFDHVIGSFPGFRVDAVSGDLAMEVLIKPRDARRLRTALLEMARIATGDKARRVILVLEQPKITASRLHEEWKGAAAVLRPELLARISIAVHQSGAWSGIPLPPAPTDLAVLEEVLRHELARCPARTVRGSEAYHEILRILLHEWLLGHGPVAISKLMEISGNSHPTVSRALERLRHSLLRHSDRSLELTSFPRHEWARLLAAADDVRGTIRFADRSGQPRSPESLLRRLRQLQREDIAVGGVLGAKHYFPALDLVGVPRLDLSIHTGLQAPDLSFVRRLDPGLEQTSQPEVSPILVVHTVRRAKSLYKPGDDGLPWADPVECLLDLHDARLESQALEFLNSFPAAKGRPL
jgi:DNA-binding transcriptional ArsR family regulator